MPAASGTSGRSTPASPVDDLAQLPEPGAGGDRRRHQEREARRGLAVQAGEQPGRDRDARAADARDERQRLGRRRCRWRSGTSGRRWSAFATRADRRATGSTAPITSVTATRRGSRKTVSIRSFRSTPAIDGRDGRRGEEPRQPAVGVAAERAIPDRGEPGRDQPEPVAPEVERAARAASPTWSITLNARLSMNGSSQPSRAGTMIRCPELETGRNSVSPCTIPSTIAWTSCHPSGTP